ncbi:histidine kinase [Streptomyces sp. NPDC021622]|uniref:sensor histidine kinase n=1 Tax=Streptomyces sp. NPDC021622 TaxID=3155013 RepID=UPI0033FE19FE
MRETRLDQSDPSKIRINSGPAPQLARTILLATLTCYLIITVINLLSADPTAATLVTGLVTISAAFALQLNHSRRGADRAPLRRRLLTLGAQSVVTYLPLVYFGVAWGGMAGFFAGSLLLLLPTRVAWPLFAATGLSLLVPGILNDLSVVDIVYMCQSTLLSGLVVYGLSRLSAIVEEVHAARAEIARMAVVNERLRLSQDLHDLLGYSLSAIVLKSELIHRLLGVQHERTEQEVTEVLSISRQALADVRRVASGYREMSLLTEVSSAQSVLVSAEVDVTVDIAPALKDVNALAGTVLATVLREAVTNLLRHSKASRCAITASIDDGTARLTIVNDGLVRDHRPPAPHSGNGLGNLEQRLCAIGGTLTIDRPQGEPDDGAPTGLFRLIAEAPVKAVTVTAVTAEPQMKEMANPEP